MITVKNHKIYSSIFSIAMLATLISFATSRELSLSTRSENFRWRKNLISVYTSLRFRLGDHIYNGTIVGEDGWMFLSDSQSIGKYQRVETLSTGELTGLQFKLDRLNKDLQAQDVDLLVVIPPDKSTIYPQYMPTQIPVLSGKKSELDQLIDYMAAHGDNFILDLRPVLLNTSIGQDMYYKTDTHWNDLGAYTAYVSIMNVLASNYPSLVPHPMSDFVRVNQQAETRDLPRIMGLASYPEEGWKLIPKLTASLYATSDVLSYGADHTRVVTNSNNQLPKLLVYHDSFYFALAQFVEPHFSRVTTIPYTDRNNIWSLDWIEHEKPDIVIIEVVERYLDVSLPKLLDN